MKKEKSKFEQYIEERNSQHYRLRSIGDFEYCCTVQYVHDYYFLCNFIWKKYFNSYNEEIKQEKELYDKYMSMSILDFKKSRESGELKLYQPEKEKPSGVEIDIDGYKFYMKDWENIATAGGQYDNED